MSLLDRLPGRRPKPNMAATPPADKIKGDSGRGHYGGFLQYDEFNQQLTGKAGLRVFDQMYRSDPDIRRSVWMAFTPMLAATWGVDPYGGDEATDQDREIAGDVAWSLGLGPDGQDAPLEGGWIGHLEEHAPVLIRSGFVPSAIGWTKAVAPSGKEVLTAYKFGLRLPRSIERWIDDGNELQQLEQFSQRSGEFVMLDRRDLLYYRIGREGDNWEGISMLRPVYKPWKIKDTVEKIDALGQEREAIGLPILFPPLNKSTDAVTLDDMAGKLQALRDGELSFLMMPGPKQEHDPEVGWAIDIVGVNGSAGSKRDAIGTLNYHRDAISAAFIQEFMRLGQGTGSTGALSTASAQQDPFMLAMQSLGDVFRLECQARYIKRFVAINYGVDVKPPKLTMSLTEGDLTELRDYVAQLVAAGALFVDDPMEDFLRERGNLPPADKEARDERQKQEQEAHATEIETKKAGLVPPPGAAGSEKTTTTQALPAGGQRVKESIKHLADAPAAPTGAMVALYPLTPDRLALTDGEAADELHITLAFLGQASAVTDPAATEAAIRAWAATVPPLTGRISGAGMFLTGADGPVTYLAPDIPGLNEPRERLIQALTDAGTSPSAQHGFTPHITVAYADRHQDAAARAGAPVRFDSVTFALAGTRIVVPLTGPLMLEETTDTEALQITTPVVGHCAHCDKPDKDCDCDKDAVATLAAIASVRQLRPHEQLMPLPRIAASLDAARDTLPQTLQPLLAAYAAETAHTLTEGRDASDTPPHAVVDAIHGLLAHLEATGRASVQVELHAQQTMPAGPVTLDDAQITALADTPGDQIGQRATLAAKAVISAIYQAVSRRYLQGITDPAVLTTAGQDAGASAARAQAIAHAPGALNEGRDRAALEADEADDMPGIKGARYTSILDADRCTPCADADDDVLRPMGDPWWLEHGPPNPHCDGWDRCRCMRFYELDDEAPANLDDGPAWRRQKRDGRGRWARELGRVTDPHGRTVSLTDDRWQHVLARHPDMASHMQDVLDTVARPDVTTPDPLAGRERYYRHSIGPAQWLRVIVEYRHGARHVVDGEILNDGDVITAFGQARPPA